MGQLFHTFLDSRYCLDHHWSSSHLYPGKSVKPRSLGVLVILPAPAVLQDRQSSLVDEARENLEARQKLRNAM